MNHQVINLEPNQESVHHLVEHLELILNSQVGNHKVMVDLSNGTVIYRNMLAVAAYVLNIPNQYMIDTEGLRKKLGVTRLSGFLQPNKLESKYVPMPQSIDLDKIAYIDLSEMVRYKQKAEEYKDKYSSINTDSRRDARFFQENLLLSLSLKLRADRVEELDLASYRIASATISNSIEDLLDMLIEKFDIGTSKENPTIRNKLEAIEDKLKSAVSGSEDKLEEAVSGSEDKLEETVPRDFDKDLLKQLNELIIYLRNKSVHLDSKKDYTPLQKIKSNISMKLSLAFIEYYTDIVHPLLKGSNEETSLIKKDPIEIPPTRDIYKKEYYFGLDGDDTGRALEKLLKDSLLEGELTGWSNDIKNAIARVKDFVNQDSEAHIIFEAGDSLLFKGRFSRGQLEEMQGLYYNALGKKATCSIGFGLTLTEAYYALKFAKFREGKNAIVGIEWADGK